MSEKLKFMKKVVKRNQVIIAALAVMIVIAGYLNLAHMDDKKELDNGKNTAATSKDETSKKDNETGTKETAGDGLDISNEDIMPPSDMPDENEEVASDNVITDDKVGDTILAENFIDGHFIGNSKLDREQVRSQNKETLEAIVSDKELSDEAKKTASDNLVNLTKAAGIEDELESLLEAKGYETVCYYGEKGVDVVVNKESLSQNDIAKIEDVITRKTDVTPVGIVITNVCVKD